MGKEIFFSSIIFQSLQFFYENEYYKLSLAFNMPPKKNEEKTSEIIEEALRPIKDAMKDIVTNKAMSNHIQKLEDKLISKLENQAKEIKNLRRRHNELEGRLAVLENLVKLQEIKSDDVEQYSRRLCFRVNDIPLKSAETDRDLENQLTLSMPGLQKLAQGGRGEGGIRVGKYNHMKSPCAKLQMFWLKMTS